MDSEETNAGVRSDPSESHQPLLSTLKWLMIAALTFEAFSNLLSGEYSAGCFLASLAVLKV